jgi:hypothetical protein
MNCNIPFDNHLGNSRIAVDLMRSTEQRLNMKKIRSLVQGLAACAIALAMISSATAQGTQGTAKVVKIKGHARYTTGNNVWQPLKLGAVLRPGTVIQTSTDKGAYVDLVLLGEGDAVVPQMSAASASPTSDVNYYQPNAEQNVVRIWENSLLAIDKLSSVETGADTVSETQLDLRAGRIFGNVKKMSAASKYEVKIPNGVAGIRGTIYEISAEGVVRVLVGSAVIAYIGPDGSPVTQVVMGGQQFDARTGQITPIAQFDQKEMIKIAKAARIGPNTPPTTFTVDHTIYYVSPTIGFNGNNGGSGPLSESAATTSASSAGH